MSSLSISSRIPSPQPSPASKTLRYGIEDCLSVQVPKNRLSSTDACQIREKSTIVNQKNASEKFSRDMLHEIFDVVDPPLHFKRMSFGERRSEIGDRIRDEIGFSWSKRKDKRMNSCGVVEAI
ncbi:hypothetical protein TNCV_4805011 [Trichonephila clavipes]|nr:hypothetical protein TNCV_4805011 [Trichonephila clavipes]